MMTKWSENDHHDDQKMTTPMQIMITIIMMILIMTLIIITPGPKITKTHHPAQKMLIIFTMMIKK